jgi:hypothetical protein
MGRGYDDHTVPEDQNEIDHGRPTGSTIYLNKGSPRLDFEYTDGIRTVEKQPFFEKLAHELSHALDYAMGIRYNTDDWNYIRSMPVREGAALDFENAVRNQSGLGGKRLFWEPHKEAK